MALLRSGNGFIRFAQTAPLAPTSASNNRFDRLMLPLASAWQLNNRFDRLTQTAPIYASAELSFAPLGLIGEPGVYPDASIYQTLLNQFSTAFSRLTVSPRFAIDDLRELRTASRQLVNALKNSAINPHNRELLEARIQSDWASFIPEMRGRFESWGAIDRTVYERYRNFVIEPYTDLQSLHAEKFEWYKVLWDNWKSGSRFSLFEFGIIIILEYLTENSGVFFLLGPLNVFADVLLGESRRQLWSMPANAVMSFLMVFLAVFVGFGGALNSKEAYYDEFLKKYEPFDHPHWIGLILGVLSSAALGGPLVAMSLQGMAVLAAKLRVEGSGRRRLPLSGTPAALLAPARHTGAYSRDALQIKGALKQFMPANVTNWQKFSNDFPRLLEVWFREGFRSLTVVVGYSMYTYKINLSGAAEDARNNDLEQNLLANSYLIIAWPLMLPHAENATVDLIRRAGGLLVKTANCLSHAVPRRWHMLNTYPAMRVEFEMTTIVITPVAGVAGESMAANSACQSAALHWPR